MKRQRKRNNEVDAQNEAIGKNHKSHTKKKTKKKICNNDKTPLNRNLNKQGKSEMDGAHAKINRILQSHFYFVISVFDYSLGTSFLFWLHFNLVDALMHYHAVHSDNKSAQQQTKTETDAK